MLTTLPSSYSLVFSPKYHTFPRRSWAYQSRVSSTSSPAMKARSRTTTVSTPCNDLGPAGHGDDLAAAAVVAPLAVDHPRPRLEGQVGVVDRGGEPRRIGVRRRDHRSTNCAERRAGSCDERERAQQDGAARRVLAMPVILAHRR